MVSINARVLEQRTRKVLVEIDDIEEKSFELKMEAKAKIKPPKDSSDNTAMFVMDMNLNTVESDDMCIQVQSEFIFEFDEIPDNYDTVATEVCLPKAQETMFLFIDEVLDRMGYPKLELSNRAPE